MEEKKILCDLKFVCAFSKSFFTKHMEWLQGHDEIAGDYGYRARDMAVRSFQDVKEEVGLFFKTALGSIREHFKLWTGPLVHFAIAGEKETAQAFAMFLAGKDVSSLGTFQSAVHDTKIDCTAFVKFLSSR